MYALASGCYDATNVPYLNAAHTIPVKSPCSGSRGWQQGPQEAIIWVRKEVNNAARSKLARSVRTTVKSQLRYD